MKFRAWRRLLKGCIASNQLEPARGVTQRSAPNPLKFPYQDSHRIASSVICRISRSVLGGPITKRAAGCLVVLQKPLKDLSGVLLSKLSRAMMGKSAASKASSGL